MKLNPESTVKNEPPFLAVQQKLQYDRALLYTVILLLLLFWGFACMFPNNFISAWNNKNLFNMHKFLHCVMFVSCCLRHNRSQYWKQIRKASFLDQGLQSHITVQRRWIGCYLITLFFELLTILEVTIFHEHGNYWLYWMLQHISFYTQHDSKC